MTSETEETDDDSEPNNGNVNNYLDSANMAMTLGSAMKLVEEEDLWIGDSEASSHMMGSEECWKPSSPFSNVHFRNTTKIAAQVLCS